MKFTKLNSVLNNRFYYSVECTTQEEAQSFYVAKILKNDTSLSIEESQKFSSLEELTKHLDNNIPLILTFTGQQIISKKIAKENGYRNKILYNANEDDFYWYELDEGEDIFVSVARKDYIDQQIQQFESNSFDVIDFGLSELSLTAVKPLIEAQDSIITNTKKLDFNGNSLVQMSSTTSQASYSLGGESISHEFIITFAAVIHHCFPKENLTSLTGMFKDKITDLKFKKATKVLGMAALVFFLGSLLISFFALDHYQSKQQLVLQELSLQNAAYQKLLALEDDKKNKEIILAESGLNNDQFISFYVNALISNIPKAVVIDKLEVFPISQKIKQNQVISFTPSLIKIEGNVAQNSILNSWIRGLKKYEWLQNIEITDLEKVNKNNAFILKLTLR